MDPLIPDSSRRADRRKRRIARAKRALIGALGGIALGVLCTHLPPEFQVPCSAASKLLGLIFGAP